MEFLFQLQPTNCKKCGFGITYNISNPAIVIEKYDPTTIPSDYPSTSPPQSP